MSQGEQQRSPDSTVSPLGRLPEALATLRTLRAAPRGRSFTGEVAYPGEFSYARSISPSGELPPVSPKVRDRLKDALDLATVDLALEKMKGDDGGVSIEKDAGEVTRTHDREEL